MPSINTGSIEVSKTIFTAPIYGEYILECWGGGSNACNFSGHITPSVNGGYSKGIYIIGKNESIYAIVGGAGRTNSGRNGGAGGFNGGGNGGYGGPTGGQCGGSGGGGASHFAKRSCLLKDMSSDYGMNLLLVAGGAGGSAANGHNDGYGGGEEGASTSTYGWTGVSSVFRPGGTQNAGYAFGVGQSAGTKTAGNCGVEGNGGGGGGLWGGYTYLGDGDGSCCSGSGGSGFVNTALLKSGSTTQNVKSPTANNGYCSISWFLQ